MSPIASAARPEELEAVCRRLVSVRPPTERDRAVQRHLELFDSGELDPAGLFAVRTPHGTIRGAMLVQEMPGAMGLAWPPAVERGRDREAIEDSLAAATCEWLRSRGVKICQAFARVEERELFASLERNGFPLLTKLVEMRYALADDQVAQCSCTIESVNESNRTAFAAALLASFEGSLDCPEAAGDRTRAEQLAGYTESGRGGELRFLTRVEGEPAGVLLLEGNELTYLGIVPRFRRRGLGSELVRFALHSAQNAGRDSLVLSVDERNRPARQLYETLGFQASGVRLVFLANWSAIS